MELKDYTIAIIINGIGYEIDLLDHKDYLKGIVNPVYSECRDYGVDVDIEKISKQILELVRNAERTAGVN